MTPVIERRWGILFFSVVMAFLTIIGGQKGSPYVLFWGYIAYQSYIGNLENIALVLKLAIGINAVGWVGIAAFMDGPIWPVSDSGKSFFLVGIGVTLVVKLALYAYVSAIRAKSAIPYDTAGTYIPAFGSGRRPSIDGADEGIYEMAMKEVDGGDRRAGADIQTGTGERENGQIVRRRVAKGG